MAKPRTYFAVSVGLLLSLQIHSTVAQYQHVWATEQPNEAYTVFNGQVYKHEKEKGFFSNLFNFDLYSNPVVQTVLGWTDSWYGSGGGAGLNDTAEQPVDPLASTGSHQYPQYTSNSKPYNLAANQYQQTGYGKNVLPSYDGKYPNSAVPPHPYYSQFQQYQQQQQQQQQPQYNQQQYQPRPQQYPSQYPQMNPYGGYPQQAVPQTVSVYSYPQGQPNVEVMNSMDQISGSLESMVASAMSNNNNINSQDRNFVAGLSNEHPSGVLADSQQRPQPKSDIEKGISPRMNYENVEQKASAKADEGSNSDLAEDHYPCPAIGQWKWDGELCIAIGPAPTWACRPNDLVTSGRIAICRNKIYFPNESRGEQ